MSQFNPSANVEALLGGYRTGESAVHTGLALAHQRQSNMLAAARMEHYNALEEARQQGIDLDRQKFEAAQNNKKARGIALAKSIGGLMDDDQPANTPPAATPGPSLGGGMPSGSMGPTFDEGAAQQIQAMLAQQARQETIRTADTARTALNAGQPLGGAMMGGAAEAPMAPTMGPSPDEPAAPDTSLQSQPGAIAEGDPKQSVLTPDEQHSRLDHRALKVISTLEDPADIETFMRATDHMHAQIEQRAKNAENKSYKDTRLGQLGQGLENQKARIDQQADQFSQRFGLERDKFGNTVRHEGITEGEQKRRQDYLEKTYGASGNKLDHDLGSLLNNGSRDQLRAQLRETSATGAPTKVALRLATMMREVGMDPDEERLLGNMDDAKEKYDALKAKPSDGWESAPEYKAAEKAAKALDDYYAKPRPGAKPQGTVPNGTPLPAIDKSAGPSDDEYEAFKAKTPDMTIEQRAAEWKKQHAGG